MTAAVIQFVNEVKVRRFSGVQVHIRGLAVMEYFSAMLKQASDSPVSSRNGTL
jgi:hypothetical protein